MLAGVPAPNIKIDVPARLGNDAAFDATAVYVCDSDHAYMTGNENDVRLARISGNKAMQSVRHALISQRTSYSDFTLVSISLLLQAQVRRPST